MVVTEFGMVRGPVKPAQPLNALLPIEVTELPRVKEPVNPLQL